MNRQRNTIQECIFGGGQNKSVEPKKRGSVFITKYFYNKNRNAKSLKTVIGYKELFSYYDKKISKEEAIDLIKKNSRHYAKRQYTWFNNKLNLNWFNVDFNNFDNTINDVENKINDYFFKQSFLIQKVINFFIKIMLIIIFVF